MSLFFDHLISTADILSELSRDDISSEEREELTQIIDELLIHHTLNVLLSQLPKDTHESFTHALVTNPANPELLALAQKHTDIDITETISKHGNKIKAEIIAEIKKARR